MTLAALLIALAGCHGKANNTANEAALGMSSPKKAWWECKFELGKLEALHGRNLDDFNRGIAVAANQFLMDCMTSKDQSISPEMTDEMGKYASAKRNPSDVRFNRASSNYNAQQVSAVDNFQIKAVRVWLNSGKAEITVAHPTSTSIS